MPDINYGEQIKLIKQAILESQKRIYGVGPHKLFINVMRNFVVGYFENGLTTLEKTFISMISR